MERIALFAGSFDPVTKGHEDLVRQALPLFDKIVVALGENSAKKPLYSVAHRYEWLQHTFAPYPTVEVVTYSGLTTDYCRQHHIQYMLRGLRNATDYTYEENIARINHMIAPEVQSVFLLCSPEVAAISSTMIRELITFHHEVRPYLPESIAADFEQPPTPPTH